MLHFQRQFPFPLAISAIFSVCFVRHLITTCCINYAGKYVFTWSWCDVDSVSFTKLAANESSALMRSRNFRFLVNVTAFSLVILQFDHERGFRLPFHNGYYIYIRYDAELSNLRSTIELLRYEHKKLYTRFLVLTL